MDVLNKFIKLHKPIGIYHIKEGGNIYRELSVYADAFEELFAEIQKAEKEGFILLAEDEGLGEIERVFSALRSDLEKEQRRKMILTRYSLGGRDFTPSLLLKIMDVLGVSGKAQEYPKQFRITFEIEGEHSLERRKWIASELKKLFPAHLEIDPVFEGFSFMNIDERNLSFKEMEQSGMCWADIDIYCEE
ncbi:MAG: hypothetical protein IKB72_04555 [Ruminococcus sp.]|nr:hypothetical protein [Ruminococcus sp.]